jgi:heat shock protein HslJ
MLLCKARQHLIIIKSRSDNCIKKKNMKNLLLTLSVILFILSCSKKTMTTSSTHTPNADFDNTRWKLTRLPGDIKLPQMEDVFIRFDAEKNQVSGKSGCNRFTGQYKLEGNKIQSGPVAVTKMMCPPELMAVENAFLKALRETETYSISGDHLMLLKGEMVLAEFKALYL